jgi:hypothetical protein
MLSDAMRGQPEQSFSMGSTRKLVVVGDVVLAAAAGVFLVFAILIPFFMRNRSDGRGRRRVCFENIGSSEDSTSSKAASPARILHDHILGDSR